jgi:protein SCO1/2
MANFNLVDQMARPISNLDLAHKIVVVNFIFTNCSFICPRINAQMAKIQEQTAQDPRVRLLSLAVDPVDDTVSVLERYSHKYTRNPDKWAFVTGEDAPMQKFIEESFLDPDKQGDFAGMPGNFVNAQRIVIVDQNGDVVEYVDGLNENAAKEVMKKISEL